MADTPTLLSHAADCESVALIIAILRVQVVAVEVEVVSVRRGSGSRRPEVAIAADIGDTTRVVVVVAGERH